MVKRYTTHCTGLLLVKPESRATYNENWKDVVLASDYDAAVDALRNLYAMVEGESPSLLEDDGNATRAWEILDSQASGGSEHG